MENSCDENEKIYKKNGKTVYYDLPAHLSVNDDPYPNYNCSEIFPQS